MTNKFICDTNNTNHSSKPTIVPVQNPDTNSIGFCLHNFDVTEPIDAYTPQELLNIRNTLDIAINENCKPSDLKGQMFFWDFDFAYLTNNDSKV
jgi:hypothetical protein